MSNPCRHHFQRVTAATAAATVEPGQSMVGANAYELQLMQLAQDRLRLKQVQSTQGKAALKRELLPAYVPYVDGVLAEGRGAQDEVLTTVMIWRTDAGDFGGALDVAVYVLEHGLLMPDRFARTTACLIAEEIATAALKAQKAGEAFDGAVLQRTAEITDGHDMPDEARAKLFLALGKAILMGIADEVPADAIEQARTDLDSARAQLVRAIDLHSNCGGKKDLERVDRLLKKYAAPAAN